MRTAYFDDTFNAGAENVPLQSPTKAASKAASSSPRKGLTPRKDPEEQAGATSTAAASGEVAPMDEVDAIADGMAGLSTWAHSRPQVPWSGTLTEEFGSASLVQLRDGQALCVEPGHGIATGENLILSWIPPPYMTMFWTALLQLELEDGGGAWTEMGGKYNPMQNFVLNFTPSIIRDPNNLIMKALRREAAAGKRDEAGRLPPLARCFQALLLSLDSLVRHGLGPLGVGFRYTPAHTYPQMALGAAAYCPTTLTGELHCNLPRCHVDSNLRNNRWIEGVQIGGGYKLTRLCPFIPGAPRESEKLAAYGVLMHGSVRYGFVRTPEDGTYVASSGAAPYAIA